MAERLDIIVRIRDAAQAGVRSVKSGLAGIGSTASATTGAIRGMYGQLAAVTALFAGGAFLGSAVKTFTQFDDVMRQAGAVTNATKEEMEAMTEQAKLMGQTTRFTASDAADGLRLLGMAGFEASEATAALPGVLNLAAAGSLDLGTSADIATNILAGFGLEVENLSQVNDVLVKTFTSSNTTLTELGESFKLVGPIAKGVGANFEDLLASIGKLGDAGLKGTLAGTSLRGAINALFNPTKEEAKLMEELSQRIGGVGLQIKDAEGNFIGFASIIDQLEQAGLRGEEALRLFGQRAGPGIAALMEAGSDSIRELQGELENAGGTADRIAEQMEAGLGGAVREAQAAFEAVKIAIGEAFAEDIIEAVRGFRDWMLEVITVIKQLKQDGTLTAYADAIRVAFKVISTAAAGAWAILNEGVKIFVAIGLAATGELGAAKEALKDFGSDYKRFVEGVIDDLANVEDQTGQRFKIVDPIQQELEKAAEPSGPIGTGGKKVAKTIAESIVPDQPTMEALMKASLARLTATLQTEAAKIEGQYNQNLISLDEYFNQRRTLIERRIQQELALLRAQAESETDTDKRALINAQIFAKEQQLQTALLQLENERYEEQDRLKQEQARKEDQLNNLRLKAEKAFQDQKIRVAGTPAFGLEAEFQDEQAKLQQRQNAELEAIQEFYTQKVQLLRENKAAEAEIEAATQEQKTAIFEQQKLQREEQLRLELDQQQRLASFQLNTISDAAGNFAQVLTTAYELTGKKNKELFAVSKAFAIAQAIMKTYEAATSAYASLAGIPYVGPVLGAAAAAAAIAAGIGYVAQIQSQSLAEGGLVAGKSPSKTADDKVINATAGEFMQPVDSVNYYGLGIMEAMRRRSIPKGVFDGFAMPGVRYGQSHFQSGGAVTAQSGGDIKNAAKEGQQTNIVNVLDPQVFDQWAASTPGQQNILNVLSENIFEVRQMIFDNQNQ